MAEAGEPEGQHAHSSVMTAIAELDKVFQPAQATPESVKRARSAASRKTASVSTPALMSVLPPSRKRQRISWLAGEQLKEVRSPKQVYRPLSEDDLLERIATFTLTLWSDRKPEGCSVVDFARRGWRCTGRKREEVTCDVCQVTWQVSPASESRLDRDALEQDIAAKHGKSCPWRSKGCPVELYRLHLSAPPQQLLRELVERAVSFPADFQFVTKHPLALQDLDKLETILKTRRSREVVQSYRKEDDTDLSRSAAIAALFSWTASKSTSSPSSSLSSPSTPSPSLILHCKLCARRLAVKGRNKDATSAEGTTEGSQTALPSLDKLSTVDVASAHRRFCPCISPIPDSKSGELGYQAFLDRITHMNHHTDHGTIAFQPSDGDKSKTNLQQTREAITYVKNLLDVRLPKRKYVS